LPLPTNDDQLKLVVARVVLFVITIIPLNAGTPFKIKLRFPFWPAQIFEAAAPVMVPWSLGFTVTVAVIGVPLQVTALLV